MTKILSTPVRALALVCNIGCSTGSNTSEDPDGGADTAEGNGSDSGSGGTDDPGYTPPDYSGGNCPILVSGVNSDFESGGEPRDFRLVLPDDPEGAPVLFAWHWLTGSAYSIINYMGWEEVAEEEGVIIVAPESNGYPSEWHFDAPVQDNPDIALFDDLVACLHEQYAVDLGRIHTTGMSAGGLWSTYLIAFRSDLLASAAPLSGGVNTAYYVSPEEPIPVLLTWGGPSDTYSGFSFHIANEDFSAALREDGHFVVECQHSGGHTIPNGAADFTWRFLDDHPKGLDSEPYAAGLPDEFPSYCSIPD